MVAFCRIDTKPIRLREPVVNPDALIIQDVTLLGQLATAGRCWTGRICIDQLTSSNGGLLLDSRFRRSRV